MSGSRKEKVTVQTPLATEEDAREVYLRDGRTLTVAASGTDEIVEVRSSSGQVELRIKLTEEGPVLQLEAVRLQLKASEAVEIESKRVDIKTTESTSITSEGEVDVEAKGDVRVNGKMIYLN
jgi:hypothetical protein